MRIESDQIAERKKIYDWLDSTKIILEKINDGSTLLHAAAQSFRIDIIDLLLKSGADVNCLNESGETPLHKAVAPGRIKKNWTWTYYQRIEEIMPVKYSKIEVLEYLLSNGADPNAGENHFEISPFHISLLNGKVEEAKLFLRYGADVYHRDDFGRSALHFANQSGNFEMLKFILDCGVNVDDKNHYKLTALHRACDSYDIEGIELLLQRGADVNSKNVMGLTPLHMLMFNDKNRKRDYPKRKEILRLLIDYSTEVEYFYSPDFDNLVFMIEIILQDLAMLKKLNLLSKNVDLLQLILKESTWKSYFNNCMQELRNSRNCRVYNDGWVTYWDLISGNLNSLSKYAGNNDLIEAIKMSNLKKKFPIYAELIYRNIRRGLKERKDLNETVFLINQTLPIACPRHVVEKIINYSDFKSKIVERVDKKNILKKHLLLLLKSVFFEM